MPKTASKNNSPHLLSQNFTATPTQSTQAPPLPSSIDAEKGVLSSMMQSPDRLISRSIEAINEEAFHVPAHRTLFKILVELYDKGHPIDLISFTQQLTDRNTLDHVGGAAAVTELFTFVPTAAHFDYYLAIVESKSTLRKIIHTCTECITQAYEGQENVAGLLDEVEKKILDIRDINKDKGFRSMKDEVMTAIHEIEKMYENPNQVTGLSSGFRNLDNMTNGLHGGEMIVIAARPSIGKTSFAMNIVENVAIDQGNPVAVFSLEMSTQQLIQRMLCSRAQVEMQKLRGGFLAKTDFPRLMEAAGKLAECQIFIDDTPSISVLELRAKARRLKQMHNIKLVAIDYLQLMRSSSRRAMDNRQIEISEISSGIKALAKELDIPVIVAAQLNREPEARTGGRPRLSDLRESGSIEQDADVVGLLLRPEYYQDDPDEKENVEGEAELIIAKQRNGPTGDIPLTFINKFMRFADRSFTHEERH